MLNLQTVQQFNELLHAARSGRLILLDCVDPVTGGSRPALCAMELDNGFWRAVPVATMLEGEPYEQLAPPEDF
jgi:hypothetical protein